MIKAPQGLVGMVWQIRRLENGDADAITDLVLSLGLSTISIKIVDGTEDRWEGNRDDQNQDLIEPVLAKLRDNGIVVIGWGYTYGRTPGFWWGIPSVGKAIAEAAKTVEVCRRYDIQHFQVDAEREYQSSSMHEPAEAYAVKLNQDGPDIGYSLCSYRYPETYQPSFPIHRFMPYMDSACPQVYFLGDNRSEGGAAQLKLSYDHYTTRIRDDVPFWGIAPTYQWNEWTASGEQLTQFFEMAVSLGHPAAGVWDLPQANAEQLQAITAFDWPTLPPSPPSDVPQRLRGIAADLRAETGSRTQALDESVGGYADEIEQVADDLEG